MFTASLAFNNPLDSWNVSRVTILTMLFAGTGEFNQDITSWDVSSVHEMYGFIEGSQKFNQDLDSWNIASVTSMYSFAKNAASFNQNLCSWRDLSRSAVIHQHYTYYTLFAGSACPIQTKPTRNPIIQSAMCQSCNRRRHRRLGFLGTDDGDF